MTGTPIRLFIDDAAIHRIGEGLLDGTLPKSEWTHEAHLAACLWLLTERPDIDVDAEIAGIMSRYNVSAGGVNDDHHGYHDTITRAFVAGVRWFLSSITAECPEPLEAGPEKLSQAGNRRGWSFPSAVKKDQSFHRPKANGVLAELVNDLLASAAGARDWPLGFYSRELLMSVPARRGFVAPDLAPLP